MNNEYVNSIHELANCQWRPWLVFLNFTANFYQCCKQEIRGSTVKNFIVPTFPFAGKSNFVVEEFNTGCSKVLIFNLELLSEVKSDHHEIFSGALVYENL